MKVDAGFPRRGLFWVPLVPFGCTFAVGPPVEEIQERPTPVLNMEQSEIAGKAQGSRTQAGAEMERNQPIIVPLPGLASFSFSRGG